jgi:hypothetical protein
MNSVPSTTAGVHGLRYTFKALIIVFVIAFAARFALVLLLPDFDVPIRGEMERVAVSWASTGQLANPYSTPTGPTAHVSPLYPIILGLIYKLFGTGTSGHLVQAAFACMISATRCVLLLLMAVLFGLEFRTGLIAAAFSVFYITAFNTELRGSWEAPLAGLFLMALTLLAMRFSNAPAFRLRTAVAYGVFCGLGVLLSPTLAPPIAAFLAATVPLGRRDWKRFAVWLSVLSATAFLVLVPWLIRNRRVMGSPVLRSNFGLELSLAYNEHERAGAIDSDITNLHPILNPTVSRHVAQVGEISFNRECERQAWSWIRKHPASAFRLFSEHVLYFWFPPATNVFLRVTLVIITVSSLLGLLQLRSRNPRAALLIGLLWLSFPLIYYVTYWSSRYRYPIEWTLLLCSVVLLDSLWQKLAPVRR